MNRIFLAACGAVPGMTPRRGAIWGALVLMVAVIAVTRLTTYTEALDRDLMAYMVIADGILHDRPLYGEMWDHKPPAVHLTYAMTAAIFGLTPLTIWVLGFTSAVATLVGCYQAGKILSGGFGGLIAAAVWTIISGDLLLQANQPNVEVFMNASLVWAFVAVLRSCRDRLLLNLLAAGFLFFIATLYKLVAAPVAFALMGAQVLYSARIRTAAKSGWKSSLWNVVYPPITVIGVMALGWLIVFGYYSMIGRFDPFHEAVFDYNQDYAGSVWGNLLHGILPSAFPQRETLSYWLMAVVLCTGIFQNLRGASSRHSMLLLAYMAGAWVAISMPGRFYPHYYQLLLPPLAVGIGWMAQIALQKRSRLWLILIVLSISIPFAERIHQLFLPVREIPVYKFGNYGYSLLETQRMAAWINENFSRDAIVYHWGSDPGVYFYAGRSSPLGFVYNMPLTDSSERAQQYSAKALAQLQQLMPDLIVVRWGDLREVDHPVEKWINENYKVITGPAEVRAYAFRVPCQGSCKP